MAKIRLKAQRSHSKIKEIMTKKIKKRMNIRLPNKKNLMLLLHSAIVLGISYLIVSCFILSTKSLSFFGVLDESGDVPMSDMYQYVNSKTKPDKLTNITLFNVDPCKDREEIAKVIEQIDSLNPKVIGLDVFFKNRKDPTADTVLENVIRKCKKLVIACELKDEQIEDNDKYNTSVRNFFVGQEERIFTEGFVNADGDANSTIRTFTPQLFLQEEKTLDTIYSFATQVARLCNDSAFQKLLQRKVNLEIINFQPLYLKKNDKNEINQERITDKIVLIGSFAEDAHKTPINLQMNGIEIHAYIISTILEGKYINRLDNFWTKSLNLLLCFLFALFCWIATTKFKKGVTILIKLAQVAILFLAFFAGLHLFNHCNIDIAYTRSIVVMGVLILIVDIYYVCVSLGHKWNFKRKKTNQNEKNNI